MTDEHKEEVTVGDTLSEMGDALKDDAKQTGEHVEEMVDVAKEKVGMDNEEDGEEEKVA